jgi:hypothetical protein
VKYRGVPFAPKLVKLAADEVERGSDKDLQLTVDVDPYVLM